MQWVKCLTVDRCLTVDPGVVSSIRPGPILSRRLIMKSFLPPFSSLPLIQEGLLSATSESMCTEYGLTA